MLTESGGDPERLVVGRHGLYDVEDDGQGGGRRGRRDDLESSVGCAPDLAVYLELDLAYAGTENKTSFLTGLFAMSLY